MSEITRDNPLHLYRATALTILPVVTDVCWKCAGTVTLADEGTYDVSRVNGNSENGYEPCHLRCPVPVVSDEETIVVDADGLRKFTRRTRRLGGRVVQSAPCTANGRPAYAVTVRFL